ncbi:ankyrin and armadillo repeat-containing protein [Platysternon megacephalum]|uniref:Ankyrin and armadillo repeat-containing protein n=1 Tax=Platysternon megacephalum TaxID=55544 RepID=A0A4D9F757_9SAUR|nr:ankyrin and armadillo repeat-containing protein [Platysternon megacephalum]
MAPRPKAFKIRSLRGPQKYGVAGRSLQELLRKGGKLLQVLPEPAAPGDIGEPQRARL